MREASITMPSTKLLGSKALRVLSALILAMLHYQVAIHVVSLGPSAEASQGVLDGLPHWRIYQSRVLGPLWMGSLERWTGLGYLPAYLMTLQLACASVHALLATFYARLGLSVLRSTALALGFVAAFTPLVWHEWFYVWDALDLVLVQLFLIGVLSSFRLGVLSCIFAATLLNHEIALIMPVWLIVLQLCEAWPLTRWTQRRALYVGAALATMVLSRLLIEWLRTTFLVREVGPQIFADYDARYADPSLQWHLLPNFGQLAEALRAFSLRGWLAVALVALGALLIRNARSAQPAVRSLAWTFLLLMAATLSFGLVFETRVYLVFIPYIFTVPVFIAQHDRRCPK
jgi:hypothetical protein